MDIFKLMEETKNKEILFIEEPSVSLQAAVAIHSTTLGRAFASCNMQNYKSSEYLTTIALQSAYYNTYRSALLHRDFGGAAISIQGVPDEIKSEIYFRTLGVFINKIGERLCLVRGTNISSDELLNIKREADYLIGTDIRYAKSGNSSVEAIAKGMLHGIRAGVRNIFKVNNLANRSFVVQGIDEIGYYFVQELLKIDNIEITITDKVYDRIKAIQDHSPSIKVVKPSEIYSQKCDIFVSCTTDDIIGTSEANQLNCKILTGSSNEIINAEKVEKQLQKKDILYIPGFVINGGEIIQLDNELKNNDPRELSVQYEEIYNITSNLISQFESTQRPITRLAIEQAEQYINAIASINKLK